MSLNIGDILTTLRDTTDPAEAFNLLFEFRKEAFQHGAQNLLKELIPLVCGSCMVGLKPVKGIKVWNHVSEDGQHFWACYAGPLLERLDPCGKSPATAADEPSPGSSK